MGIESLMLETKHQEIIDFMEKEIPFNRFLGIQVAKLDAGLCLLQLPWRAEFIGDPMRVAAHGGVLSTLIDTAGGAACWSLLSGRDERLSTVDLRVDYLRPGPPEDLFCEARVVRMGNRVSVARMAVFCGQTGPDENPIATGQGVYSIVKKVAK